MHSSATAASSSCYHAYREIPHPRISGGRLPATYTRPHRESARLRIGRPRRPRSSCLTYPPCRSSFLENAPAPARDQYCLTCQRSKLSMATSPASRSAVAADHGALRRRSTTLPIMGSPEGRLACCRTRHSCLRLCTAQHCGCYWVSTRVPQPGQGAHLSLNQSWFDDCIDRHSATDRVPARQAHRSMDTGPPDGVNWSSVHLTGKCPE